MIDKKRRWINYECTNCGRKSPRMKNTKSGIVICPTCGYPVKRLKEE